MGHPPPPAPLGELYRASRERICALVVDADPTCVVPATPLWNVHDVVAHLAGIVDDAISGNMEGVTTDPWTAAQVERGRGRPVAELVSVWCDSAPLVEATLSGSPGGSYDRAVLDILTHEADLSHALGVTAQLPSDALAWAAAVLEATFHAGVADTGLDAVGVQATDWEWFRGRLGRRTEAEVTALAWSADPAPYLATWFVFGRAVAPLGELAPATS
jgi:uncharacterized protein (TIGR03083 family)